MHTSAIKRRFRMMRNRGKELAFIAIIAVTGLFVGGCCCDDIVEKILEKYDYVKGVKCKSDAGVKGCITIQEQGHLEIKVEHVVEIEEACIYKGSNTSPQMNVGFKLPDTMENTGQAVCFEFNGDAISFDPDPAGQAELEAEFGGTWAAYMARTPVFPALGDSVMDDMHFSYHLTFVTPFDQGPGLQDFEYDIAVRDPDTGMWVNSPTHRHLDFDPVLISFSDSRAEQLPIVIQEGETLIIERVYALLKNESPTRVDVYLLIKQFGNELVRLHLLSPQLPSNVVLGPFFLMFPTNGLGPGIYTAALEITAFGQPDEVLGGKSVPIRVE
jgi:hypothetical protein